jgi:quercetin dioxygenase-like cupin family protein
MSTTTQLPAPRLVVTTHTKEGTSVFASDEQIAPFQPFGPNGSSFARFHSRLSVPVGNMSMPPDLSNTLPRCPPNGVMFCTTDIPPKGAAPMHRTLSLDYAAVISGEIVLLLDGGEEKTIRAGEYIVQRGVNHSWINRSEAVCRIMCVMVGAEKIVLEDGTELGETVFNKK